MILNLITAIYRRMLKRLKKSYYKLQNKISFGNDCVFDLGTHLYVGKNSKILLGNNCYIKGYQKKHQTALPFKACLYAESGGTIKIGDNTRIAGYIKANKSINIGKNCMIAAGVNIIDSNGVPVLCNNRTNWDVYDMPQEINIGNNVWICLNSVILKGTTIGENCVVSAGSVVKGHFPSNVIIQGNPAVIVKEINI